MNKENDKDLNVARSLDDTIALTAYETVVSVEGVAGMSANIPSISNLIGRGNQKGIKINSSDIDVSIDVYVLLEYGVKIPDVAWNIQEAVKKAVENIAKLTVKAVNIHVQGVTHKTNNKNN